MSSRHSNSRSRSRSPRSDRHDSDRDRKRHRKRVFYAAPNPPHGMTRLYSPQGYHHLDYFRGDQGDRHFANVFKTSDRSEVMSLPWGITQAVWLDETTLAYMRSFPDGRLRVFTNSIKNPGEDAEVRLFGVPTNLNPRSSAVLVVGDDRTCNMYIVGVLIDATWLVLKNRKTYKSDPGHVVLRVTPSDAPARHEVLHVEPHPNKPVVVFVSPTYVIAINIRTLDILGESTRELGASPIDTEGAKVKWNHSGTAFFVETRAAVAAFCVRAENPCLGCIGVQATENASDGVWRKSVFWVGDHIVRETFTSFDGSEIYSDLINI